MHFCVSKPQPSCVSPACVQYPGYILQADKNWVRSATAVGFYAGNAAGAKAACDGNATCTHWAQAVAFGRPRDERGRELPPPLVSLPSLFSWKADACREQLWLLVGGRRHRLLGLFHDVHLHEDPCAPLFPQTLESIYCGLSKRMSGVFVTFFWHIVVIFFLIGRKDCVLIIILLPGVSQPTPPCLTILG